MQGSRKEEGGLIATTLPPNGLTTNHLPPHPPTPPHLPQRPNCLTAKQKRQNFWAKWLICRGVGLRIPFWFAVRVVCKL